MSDRADPPFVDPDTERHVVASCLTHGRQAYQAAARWITGHRVFWSQTHAVLWWCLARLARTGIPDEACVVELAQVAQDTSLQTILGDGVAPISALERIGGFAELAAVSGHAWTTLDVDRLSASAERLRVLFAHRRMHQAVRTAEDRCQEPGADPGKIVDTLHRLRRRLYEFSGDESSMGDIAAEVGDEDLKPPVVAWWALPPLDRHAGIRARNTTIIAARPGGGKTSMMIQLAATNAKLGTRVSIISLEMPKKDLFARVRAFDPSITQAELDRINVADGRHTCREIGPAIERAADSGSELVMVDYLQKVKTAYRGQRSFEAISEASDEATEAAKKTGAAVVLLSQIGREKTKTKRRRAPGMDDLKGSGDIEQDASLIIMLWPLSDPGPEVDAPQDVGIVCPKQRWGKALWQTGAVLDGARSRFYPEGAQPSVCGMPLAPPDVRKRKAKELAGVAAESEPDENESDMEPSW